ncbi:hypothetical protein Dthio_PD3193 [Desulfonatronospira thiodismutans ASO3-1]|uniref:Uncharacterized protein n=1 Tax=Desulfonatronospira thiodismutans ASO3-1 TaxID=555779 RepID=D6SM51_9BACT|nr:hypothetical protein Dthio_PD3193 [Desulfonatronospira thiodismutans ASO3-1]
MDLTVLTTSVSAIYIFSITHPDYQDDKLLVPNFNNNPVAPHPIFPESGQVLAQGVAVYPGIFSRSYTVQEIRPNISLALTVKA